MSDEMVAGHQTTETPMQRFLRVFVAVRLPDAKNVIRKARTMGSPQYRFPEWEACAKKYFQDLHAELDAAETHVFSASVKEARVRDIPSLQDFLGK